MSKSPGKMSGYCPKCDMSSLRAGETCKHCGHRMKKEGIPHWLTMSEDEKRTVITDVVKKVNKDQRDFMEMNSPMYDIEDIM